MATRISLPVLTPVTTGVPQAQFVRLASLWIQVTGTWCNLECSHCINTSGPNAPWLKPLHGDTVRRAIREAAELGVKEIYFTGGEPFLHAEILALLDTSLEVAPTTVLTNGTVMTGRIADALRVLAEAARYSLEIRVSLDDPDPALNDRIRGRGAWRRAVRALRLLADRGLLPIVTATEILEGEHPPGEGMYRRFRDFLLTRGIEKPRVKIIPVFPVGRLEAQGPVLDEATLEGFDRGLLQCAETRVVADGGVYACPILAGLPGARLSSGSLEESFRPAPLYHPGCVTCHQTGMTCRNF
jgi:sulfatase maturation enzyme AslB (radical SAM superfamily)